MLLRKCLMLLLAGVILIATSVLVLDVAYALLMSSLPPFVTTPPPPFIITLVSVLVAYEALKTIGCLMCSISCGMLFLSRDVDLKPAERVAALIGLLFFTWLLFAHPGAYYDIISYLRPVRPCLLP
ncbi:hypothetical protein DRO33_05455 [Candidatus Bathyarchaeota archaeon]|nr:MAG: hypothetical protein DRO33_05455 [Candidatus Bathyarchaeota archaeon]